MLSIPLSSIAPRLPVARSALTLAALLFSACNDAPEVTPDGMVAPQGPTTINRDVIAGVCAITAAAAGQDLPTLEAFFYREGERVQRVDIFRADPEFALRHTFEYGSGGELSSVTAHSLMEIGGQLVPGREFVTHTWQYGEGITTRTVSQHGEVGEEVTVLFDESRRPTELRTETPLRSSSRTYLPDGRPLVFTSTLGGEAFERAFSYDSGGRLASWRQTGGQDRKASFAYDGSEHSSGDVLDGGDERIGQARVGQTADGKLTNFTLFETDDQGEEVMVQEFLAGYGPTVPSATWVSYARGEVDILEEASFAAPTASLPPYTGSTRAYLDAVMLAEPTAERMLDVIMGVELSLGDVLGWAALGTELKTSSHPGSPEDGSASTPLEEPWLRVEELTYDARGRLTRAARGGYGLEAAEPPLTLTLSYDCDERD